jgi:hypothetical protein
MRGSIRKLCFFSVEHQLFDEWSIGKLSRNVGALQPRVGHSSRHLHDEVRQVEGTEAKLPRRKRYAIRHDLRHLTFWRILPVDVSELVVLDNGCRRIILLP